MPPTAYSRHRAQQFAQALQRARIERQHTAPGAAGEVLEQLCVAPGQPIGGVVQRDQADAARAHGVSQFAASGGRFLKHIADVEDNADALV